MLYVGKERKKEREREGREEGREGGREEGRKEGRDRQTRHHQTPGREHGQDILSHQP